VLLLTRAATDILATLALAVLASNALAALAVGGLNLVHAMPRTHSGRGAAGGLDRALGRSGTNCGKQNCNDYERTSHEEAP
jgi:hypothetical protein